MTTNTIYLSEVYLWKADDSTVLAEVQHGNHKQLLRFFAPVSDFVFYPAKPRNYPELRLLMSNLTDIYIHCDINGNSGEQSWFAFHSYTTLQLFLTLMKGQGVGAKTAFNIINAKGANHLHSLILNNDQAGFAKLKGVGPKRAPELTALLFTKPENRKAPVTTNPAAVCALVTLGYAKAAATFAVQKVLEGDPSLGTEAVIKLALQVKP